MHFAKSINPKLHAQNVWLIDIPINFRVISEKLNKERQSINKEIKDKNISKYIPGLAERAYQRIINFIKAKRQLVDPSFAEI